MELGSLEYDRRWHCTATATSLTRHRAATPAERTRQASCRYAYEPDPTSLAPICPANLTSPRADTPTTPTTCHADMPVTRTRLGRASLPRFPWPDGAWLPGIRPSLALYCHCDLVDKTPRRYACGTNPTSPRTDTPATPITNKHVTALWFYLSLHCYCPMYR